MKTQLYYYIGIIIMYVMYNQFFQVKDEKTNAIINILFASFLFGYIAFIAFKVLKNLKNKQLFLLILNCEKPFFIYKSHKKHFCFLFIFRKFASQKYLIEMNLPDNYIPVLIQAAVGLGFVLLLYTHHTIGVLKDTLLELLKMTLSSVELKQKEMQELRFL